MKLTNRLDYRKRRHLRLRNKIRGTKERPRMCVSITNRHIYVQFVDDDAAQTLASWSSVNDETIKKNNVAIAQSLGKRAAELALEKGIKEVVFDRGGNSYKGRVKAIADAARAAGIKI